MKSLFMINKKYVFKASALVYPIASCVLYMAFPAYANIQSLKNELNNRYFAEDKYNQVDLNQLTNFKYNEELLQSSILSNNESFVLSPSVVAKNINTLEQAIQTALQRNPDISQTIALLSSQQAYVDVARAGYYPQISGGLSSADLTSGERGRQVLSLNATQMLYDFGKVGTSVNIQQARARVNQAQILVDIEDISQQVASHIINIKRYQELENIAQNQIKGIKSIAEIAKLRAKAGISSQADPIQAQSYIQSSEANLVMQQTQLKLYQQRLKTLVGFDVKDISWNISDSLLQEAMLYQQPDLNRIPRMMVANAEIEVSKIQKQSVRLSNYPTINLKGSLNQAVNGRNPNNNKDNGLYSSVMLEANSNFYQGGAVTSQVRAASFEEEAARAKLNSIYLEVQDQIQLSREQIEQKKLQMKIFAARAKTTAQTKELYQEQYKLGSRTAVDLLNAEQSIHSAAQEIANTRYDIYDTLIQYIAATGKAFNVYQLNNLSIQGIEVQP